MKPGDFQEAASAPVYDEVPLKPEEVVLTTQTSGEDTMPATGHSGGQDRSFTPRYKANLQELQDVVRLLEAERLQMNRRQELLVDQHTKIDDGLQVILDEIAALKAQAAQDNDMNVLMVQFIVVAVRLFVQAAFNRDKVDELLPTLEAELESLQLPARHPRLLACFNRLREACGKPPLSLRTLESMAVVISAASPSESCPSRSPSETESHGSSGAVVSASSSSEAFPSRSRSGDKHLDSESPPTSNIPFTPLPTQTSLVDESNDEKKQPSVSTSEQFPAVLVNNGTVVGTPTQSQLPKLSASPGDEIASKRESVFTPGERRRTATAIGDGDLPLFQQFAVAGAAPAPDEFSGLRKPLDTAALSKSPKSESSNGGPSGKSPKETQHRDVATNQDPTNSSIGLGDVALLSALSAEDTTSGNRDLLREWCYPDQPSGSKSGPQQPTQASSSRVQNPPTIDVDTKSLGSNASLDAILKHATTILSMSPSELSAALLQRASGDKSDGNIRQLSQQPQPKGEIVGPASHLNSNGPPAPAPSIVTSISSDQLHLVQEAMAAVAKAAEGELKRRGKQLEDDSRKEITRISSSNPSLSKTYEEQNNTGGYVGPTAPQIMGSPFAGRIAPPSTPDALARPNGEYIKYHVPLEVAPYSPGLGLPANQKAWEPSFNSAAASEFQRKENAYWGNLPTTQAQWSAHSAGQAAHYQTSLENARAHVQGEPMNLAAGHGLVYPPVRPGTGMPRVLVSSTHRRDPKQREPPLTTTAIAPQQVATETPRVEGGWACCRRITYDGNHGRRRAPNS